jgi:hypothetical protein
MLTAEICTQNGLDDFDRVRFWTTPVADCSQGEGACVPITAGCRTTSGSSGAVSREDDRPGRPHPAGGGAGATLEFWRALGFDVLHDQRRPYVYLSVRRGDLQLDFSGGLPEGTMLVVTENADTLHGAFRAGLKAALGRVPRTGLPRRDW